jgi:hypothetical protein
METSSLPFDIEENVFFDRRKQRACEIIGFLTKKSDHKFCPLLSTSLRQLALELWKIGTQLGNEMYISLGEQWLERYPDTYVEPTFKETSDPDWCRKRRDLILEFFNHDYIVLIEIVDGSHSEERIQILVESLRDLSTRLNDK